MSGGLMGLILRSEYESIVDGYKPSNLDKKIEIMKYI